MNAGARARAAARGRASDQQSKDKKRMSSILNVGSEKQLFIDDHCVDEQSGTRREFHQPKKFKAGNPVLAPQEPWESAGVQAYGNVLYDPALKQFRMWYNASYEPTPGKLYYTICHATSADGICWQRSKLNRIEHEGMALGNAILQGPYRGPTVLHTPDDPDPARRYKMFVYTGKEILDHTNPGPGFMAYSVLFSPDGLNWTPYKYNPVLQGGDIGTCCYDPVSREYLSFPKVCRTDEGFYRRCVGVSVSEDFTEWSAPIQILTGDPTDDARVPQRLERFKNLLVFDNPSQYNGQMYGMTGFRYEGLRMGLVWFYEVSGLIPQELGGNDDGVICTQLAYSRARCPRTGWKRVEGRPDFIPCGNEDENDAAYAFAVHGVVERDDELWFYYNACNRSHGWFDEKSSPGWPQPRTRASPNPVCINLAKLRRDGFASINADQSEGRLTTKPLIVNGARLEINADAADGRILVEVLDARGQPVPGFDGNSCIAFDDNAVRRQIVWQANRSFAELRDTPIRLVFRMRNAKLYAFQFV